MSQSTFFFVLQKMTAWVMVRVSPRSARVSNFLFLLHRHEELLDSFQRQFIATDKDANLIPLICLVISNTPTGSVADTSTTCVSGGTGTRRISVP